MKEEKTRRVKQTESYKQYMFLVPIMEKKPLTFAEIGDLLEERGFNKGSVNAVICTLTNHVPLYQPGPCLYKVLTDKDLDDYEQKELQRRQMNRILNKGKKK